MKNDSRLPHWVLENFVVVDDEYLSPKQQAAPQPDHLTIPIKVLTKWVSFRERHNQCEAQIEQYIKQSKREPFDPRLRHAFSTVLGIKPAQEIMLASAWMDRNTSLWFIIADGVLIEFVTFRALRTLKAKALHVAQVEMAGMPESLRLENIGKQSFRREIQGGRLNQERSPRDRWKKTKER